MATAPVIAFVSVEDYLRMASEHDAEYVEGRIEKRPVPEFDHADMTAALIVMLRLHAKAWNVRVTGDPRTQTQPTRFRLPDVCVTSASEPREQILRTPPLLCVEVLSPEDRLNHLAQGGGVPRDGCTRGVDCRYREEDVLRANPGRRDGASQWRCEGVRHAYRA